jgi:hypothetical protein
VVSYFLELRLFRKFPIQHLFTGVLMVYQYEYHLKCQRHCIRFNKRNNYLLDSTDYTPTGVHRFMILVMSWNLRVNCIGPKCLFGRNYFIKHCFWNNCTECTTTKWSVNFQIYMVKFILCWTIIFLQKGRKLIGNCWIFSTIDDGSYRARTVAKGFSQYQAKTIKKIILQ